MIIYFLLGSFFPKGDYYQVVKLMELGQHFRLHVQEAGKTGREVSFLHFLLMHYSNTRSHEGNHDQDHKNLPFYHIHITVDYVMQPAWEIARLLPSIPEQAQPASTCSLLHREYTISVFHPPVCLSLLS